MSKDYLITGSYTRGFKREPALVPSELIASQKLYCATFSLQNPSEYLVIELEWDGKEITNLISHYHPSGLDRCFEDKEEITAAIAAFNKKSKDSRSVTCNWMADFPTS